MTVTFASTPAICYINTTMSATTKPVEEDMAYKGSTSSVVSVMVSAVGQTPHMFIVGSDKALWHAELSGPYSWKWESLGGTVKDGTAPTVITPTSSTMKVFVVGRDALYSRTWDGAAWGAWVKENTQIKQ